MRFGALPGAALGLLLCTSAAVAQAAGPEDMSIKDIRRCMADNAVRKGTLRDLELVSTDEEGQSRTLKAKLYWSPDRHEQPRIRLRVNAPEALAGSSYLMTVTPRGEEVFIFLPALKAVRRVSGQDGGKSLWGTDFSYNDIKQLQGLLAEGRTERAADAEIEGRPVFVLRTQPDAGQGPFSRIVSYVDQQSCILLRAMFYADAPEPRKILDADVSSLLQAEVDEEPVWIVFGYTMRDMARGTRSTMSLGGIDLLWAELPPRAFDPRHFFETFKTDG